MQKSYLSQLLSKHRVELECDNCGEMLSIDAMQSENRYVCPFCEIDKGTGTAHGSRNFKLPVQAQTVRFPFSIKNSEPTWHDRYVREKRSWMRRRRIEKGVENILSPILSRIGPVAVLFAATLIGVGLLAFALGGS